MEYLLKTPDGRWLCSTGILWSGDCSTVKPSGALVGFLVDYFQLHPAPIWFYMPRADGDVEEKAVWETIERHGGTRDDPVVVATLSQRFPVFSENINSSVRRVLYMPQDDGIFANGLMAFFDHVQIPWDTKRPKVFWRGSCSADFKKGEFLRRDTVAALLGHPAADVKLVKNWHEGKNIPESYFAEPQPIPHFIQHKYILILDGNGLSSNHTWVFGSGSVPVVVSNCRFWFESHLIPYKNYVPVRYDLSDLTTVLEWLIANDDEARAIAEGALTLSRTIFTPAFQRDYLRAELDAARTASV